MPPVYYLGDRLNGLEATIVEQEDGSTAVEVVPVGTATVEMSEPSMEQLLTLIWQELQKITLGMSLQANVDLTEASYE